MKYWPYFEYDKSKLDFARKNRKNMTESERKIWYLFLRKRPIGYKFLRQKQLWPFIADFYCSKLRLVIEIDWSSHNVKFVEDANRTDYINDMWINVIRFTNNQIDNCFALVCKEIKLCIKERVIYIREELKFELIE